MSPQKQEPEITDPRILRAQEAARKKGKDKDSKGKPAKKASQKNSKGVAATAPDPDTFEAPVGGAPTDGLGMRGRRLVAQAYLQLSQVREQEWRYRKALDYALEALAWAESSLRDAPDASMVHALDNDVNERSLLPPELWMDCKMTIARLCYRMGSPSAATDALESLRADTRSMQDKWRGWLAEVMTQRCALLQGTILESCRQLKGLLDASVSE